MTVEHAVGWVLDALAPAAGFLMAALTFVLAVDHWQFGRKGISHSGVLWTYPLHYRRAAVQAGRVRMFVSVYLLTSLACLIMTALVLWHFLTRGW